jgi:hypothetical protein
MLKCHKCNAVLDEDANFCTECGAQVGKAEMSKLDETNETESANSGGNNESLNQKVEDDTEADYKLAKKYYENKDYEKAFKLYEKAAVGGHVKSKFELGALYFDGVGCNENRAAAEQLFKEAKPQLEKMARQGDADAQLIWSLLACLEGNYGEAMYCFEKWAKEGNAEIQLFLALIMYCIGRDNAQETERQVKEKKNPHYVYKLVNYYLQDYEKAKYWLERSAENGNANAQQLLALMYCTGKENAAEFEEEMKREGKRGECRSKLAQYYSQDYEKAKYWCEKSAENGCADAQYILALMYCVGKEEAAEFESQLKAQGEPSFMAGLAPLYLQDYEKAKYWAQKAADQGNEEAKELLKDL